MRPDRASRKHAQELHATAIDAFWLQRKLGAFFDDASEAQSCALDVLASLGKDDPRACETDLVLRLGVDKFDLIRLLLHNRARVYYCTRLKRARTEMYPASWLATSWTRTRVVGIRR